MTHIVTGTVTHVFKFHGLMARMYALAFVSRFPPRHNRILAKFRAKMLESLCGGKFIPGGEPNGEDMFHTHAILSLIILRPLRTRGRVACIEATNEEMLRHI